MIVILVLGPGPWLCSGEKEGRTSTEREHAWTQLRLRGVGVASQARPGHSAVSCNNKETVRLTGGRQAQLNHQPSRPRPARLQTGNLRSDSWWVMAQWSCLVARGGHQTLHFQGYFCFILPPSHSLWVGCFCKMKTSNLNKWSRELGYDGIEI